MTAKQTNQNQKPAGTAKSKIGLGPILLFAFAVALVVGVDQLTKILVEMNLREGEAWLDWGIIAIRRFTNTGIAWGLFSDFGDILTWIIPFAVAALALYYLYFLKQAGATPFATLGAALILGGAVGNAIDRLRQGGVTDFIDPSFWPNFNIADSAISVGFVIVLITLLLMARESRSQAGDRPNSEPNSE